MHRLQFLPRWLLLLQVKQHNLDHYLEATGFDPDSDILSVAALVLGLQRERALIVILPIRIFFCIWEKEENTDLATKNWQDHSHNTQYVRVIQSVTST